jgi:hypothetical protein
MGPMGMNTMTPVEDSSGYMDWGGASRIPWGTESVTKYGTMRVAD